MKPWKLLPSDKFKKALGERGQSLVEFVLLLFVITTVSFGFVMIMNKNVGRYWKYAANLVVDDKPGTKTVKFQGE